MCIATALAREGLPVLEALKAMAHAGWLAPERERQLSMLSVDWKPDRTRGDADWDARMTELLAFRRQQGHVQVLLTPFNCTSLVNHFKDNANACWHQRG